jgi:hypothetical protein
MGRGDQGQGHRPSSGLIHALHQGWERRGVCVCPMRGTGGGGGHGCRKLQIIAFGSQQQVKVIMIIINTVIR